MELINCYTGFEETYSPNMDKRQVQETWYNFMEKYEYVRRLCIDDYTQQGYYWKDIAYDRVFNYDQSFVERMTSTAKLLEEIIISMKDKLTDFYSLERDDTVIIIYHGLGNAAGWVTTYNGRPAIYLGIEKIVELGWDSRQKLEDLVSHEYGHLIHMEIRKAPLAPFLNMRKKVLFRMYTEGVATFFEGIFNGREVSSPKWYKRANELESELRKELLTRLEKESKDSEDFFGDWNPVMNLNEAGYFLGLQVIKILVTRMTFNEVMRLSDDVVLYVFEEYLKGNLQKEMSL